MSLLSQDREPFRLLSMQGMSDQDESDLFSFSGSVGPNGDNRREDIIKAQTLLAKTGDFRSPFEVPTGWPSSDLFKGIKAFQTRRGKQPDGTLLPIPPGGVDEYGVGESLYALRGDVGADFAGQTAPTPQQVDAHYEEEAKRLWMGEDALTPISAQNGIVLIDVPDAAPPQARPGEQVAFAPAAVPIVIGAARAAPAIVNLLRGTAGALAGGAAASLSGDTPAPEQAAPPDHDQARTPDPAQLEEDRRQADAVPSEPKRGRIVIAEDGRELHVPPLEPWADELDDDDRQLAESLNDALAIEMAKGGGGRGNPLTQRDVNIAIQECIEAAKREFPDAEVRHVYGGNQNGKSDGKRLKEEHLWEYDDEGNKVRRGSRRPDWGIVIARNIVEMARGNTVDTRKGGEPSTRETEAKQGIEEKTEGEKMMVVAKSKPPMTEKDFRAEARKVCADTMKEIRMDWTRRGEFEKPAPKQPGDYAGPASARKAAERRRLLGK